MQSKACAAPKSWYLAISSNDAVPVAFRTTTLERPFMRSARKTAIRGLLERRHVQI